MRLPMTEVASAVVDGEDKYGYFADNSKIGNSTITKVDLKGWKVVNSIQIPDEHAGQLTPMFHPTKNELLILALNGIVRIDLETLSKISTEPINHGFVFSRGPGSLAVVGLDRVKLSLVDLDTFQLIPSDMDSNTAQIGTPWFVHWFVKTNTLLVLYDLGGFNTFEYRYQYYDMSDFSVIDDGTLSGPGGGLIQKTNSGVYDRNDTSVFLKFYGGSYFIQLDFNNCNIFESGRSNGTEITKPITTGQTEIKPLTDIEEQYFLAVIIVGSIVGVLLIIAIGVGILLVVQRMPKSLVTKV